MGIGVYALLAGGDHGVAAVVAGADDQYIFAGRDKIGNVKGKADIAAAVLADAFAVEINGGLVVYCAEMEHHPAGKRLLGNVQNTGIPAGVDEVGMADAGQGGFGAEGDFNHAVKRGALEKFFVRAVVFFVKSEGPGTVEVDPVLPAELRIGKFRTKHNIPPKNDNRFIFSPPR